MLCANIYGQNILTIEKPGQVTKLMKPSIFRKGHKIDSVNKLIIKGRLTKEDISYLNDIDIKNVYIGGELNDEDKKREYGSFTRSIDYIYNTISYVHKKAEYRRDIDTLFVPSEYQWKSSICDIFDPKFIYIQDTEVLILNRWAEDIKQIDQVDYIMPGAFAKSKIKEITIPSKVKTIPVFCFLECKYLKSVTFNNSVQRIKYGAFKGTNITNITLPKSLTSIEYSAFKDCTLEKCKINASIPPKIETNTKHPYDITINYHKQWLKPFENCILEIPKDSYTNYKSDEFWAKITMGESGGKRSYNITLNRPGTILSQLPMSSLAFIDSLTITGFMYQTETDVIKKCISLKYLDLRHAFISVDPKTLEQEQEQLKEFSAYVQLMGMAGEMAYKDKKISSIEYLISKGLAELGKSATEFKKADNNCYVPSDGFYGLTQLKTVKLPLRAESIGHRTFKGCINLENVEFPPYLLVIGKEAFANCPKLKIEKLPSTITTLYDGIFKGCTSLDWIDLSSCKMKGEFNLSIFSRANLKGIYLPQGIQSVNGTISDAQVFIPKSVEKLKASFHKCKLHFQSQTPPKNESDGLYHNIFYIPKGCTTAYFTSFGDKTYIEEAGW